MMDLGAFPAINIDVSISTIQGEVFEVTSETLLKSLDMLEGYPDFYNRMEVPIVLDGGETVLAWMYYLNNTSTYKNIFITNGQWIEDRYIHTKFIEHPPKRINTYEK